MAAEAREAAQEAALTDAAYCSIIYAIDNKRSADDGCSFVFCCAAPSLLMILCVLSLVCVCACEAIVARLLLEERYCVCVRSVVCVSLC